MNPTSKKITLIFACFICLMNTACTTIKPVYNTPEATIASQLEPGDRVSITFINDRAKEITITEVNETGIKGTLYKASKVQPKGAIVEAEWGEVYSIETVKISAIKTAGATVGVAVAIPFVAAGLLLAGFAGG
jgi:hypothetical protein